MPPEEDALVMVEPVAPLHKMVDVVNVDALVLTSVNVLVIVREGVQMARADAARDPPKGSSPLVLTLKFCGGAMVRVAFNSVSAFT